MAELKKSSIARRLYGRANGRSRVSMNRLKILVTVVNRAKADFYMDHIQSFGVNMQMLVFGHGTAPREIATAMGLADSERAVIFSVIGENNLRAALDSLGEKFNTIAGGKGIAYTIPMSSIIGKSIFNFLSDNRDAVRRNEA
ncbi:hypothetical protein SAMN05720761_11757 [Fibrobacter sp. UWCM]|jgi:hypothetical protein|uniref:hypothetical protein n=1 Tax=Fibrobacter sp. UWCM TaxID=1896208 RepID=UPI00092111D1|nr:hypothetical protein [Fibrobacter sp. UWCM]MBO6136437.1 hypothetical protein [Fibrobacter sp.]SHH54243.1 hypothetical protein SAMN05720761_11757 [Fibrobacter sp. UWCM]